MKQFDLFGKEKTEEDKYNTKIEAPIYEPKNRKPHIKELYNPMKANRLIRDIENSNITEDEKVFLIAAAKRHNQFNYSKIADYYAHSSKDMQLLMERSALVIIDFNKAIQYGYVELCSQIVDQYSKDIDE